MVKLENVQCVIDIGITIASCLQFSQQCKDAARKPNRMLGFISRNFSFKNKDYISAESDSIWNTLRNFGPLILQRI